MEENASSFSVSGNGNVSQMAKPLAPDMEQLTRDFRSFVSDCETLLKNATTLSGSGAAIARAQLSEGMSAAKVKFDALKTTATERAARTRSATEEYVRREPMKAIGYAAAAGALVGLLMARR